MASTKRVYSHKADAFFVLDWFEVYITASSDLIRYYVFERDFFFNKIRLKISKMFLRLGTLWSIWLLFITISTLSAVSYMF